MSVEPIEPPPDSAILRTYIYLPTVPIPIYLDGEARIHGGAPQTNGQDNKILDGGVP